MKSYTEYQWMATGLINSILLQKDLHWLYLLTLTQNNIVAECKINSNVLASYS